MSYRRLALVMGLTVGDYVLWNWSLNANHEVVALVSGLTLPPLALVALWLLILALGGLLAGRTSRKHPVTMRRASKGASQRHSLDAHSMRENAHPAGRSGKIAA